MKLFENGEKNKMRLSELLQIKHDYDAWILTNPAPELIEKTKSHLINLNERIAEERAKIAEAETDPVLKAKIEFWNKKGRLLEEGDCFEEF